MAQTPDPAKLFSREPDFSEATLSPTGEFIAADTQDKDGKHELSMLKLSSGERHVFRFQGGEDRFHNVVKKEPYNLTWSDDNRLIVFEGYDYGRFGTKSSSGNIYAINIAIGMLSAVVDNVPLVAGAMKMYPLVTPEALASAGDQAEWLAHFVQDGHFWEMLAYCAGTGGSCLIIGSAAGVAAMGMERINFFWYLRHISGLALLGYLGGVAAYALQHSFF